MRFLRVIGDGLKARLHRPSTDWRCIDLDAAADGLREPWHPIDLIPVNEAIVRLAKLEGSFQWHAHDEDELFLCWRGHFTIELEAQTPVALGPGSVFVVPRGTRHRPVAEYPAWAILLERPEPRHYGNDERR